MLRSRVITGAFIFIATCLVLVFSHIPWFLNTVIALLCLQAIYELYRATGVIKNRALYASSCIIAALLSYVSIPHYEAAAAVIFIIAVAFFIYIMLNIGKMRSVSPVLSALIACFIVCFYKTMSGIRGVERGAYTLALALFVCNVGDVAAYFVGKRFGKHKLAPVISPHKTVEGSVGGIVCTVILFLCAALLLDKTGVVSVHYARLAVYLAVASVVGQFGDLSMSAVKRIVGIKDYGALLPGHGGMLDRFDSLLFVLPFTYLFCLAAGPVFC
ncbi:MAG: phosphatidate cytidylyltransferase [Eubacteriales bacterium]